jgi:predicted O-methyltransferase YrrM
MTFQEALEKYFRFTRDPNYDNLPILATGRYHWGVHGDHGRNALAKLMGALEFRKGVEIGTRFGESSRMWCKANPHLHLTCIDPYIAYHARPMQSRQDTVYAKTCKLLKPFNITLLRTKSMDAVNDFEDASLDFVYIDGDHCFDACMQDIIRWVPKVKLDGLVVVHDYCAFERGGVIKSIDAYTHCHRIDPWYVTRDHMPTAFWHRSAERASSP